MGALTARPLRTTLLPAALFLAACTAWPPPGQGGAAERGRTALPPTAERALADRLACSLARFDAVRSGAESQGALTGRVATAAELAARAQREAHGGLVRDAALSLDRLEAETVAIGVQLPGAARPTPPDCA